MFVGFAIDSLRSSGLEELECEVRNTKGLIGQGSEIF